MSFEPKFPIIISSSPTPPSPPEDVQPLQPSHHLPAPSGESVSSVTIPSEPSLDPASGPANRALGGIGPLSTSVSVGSEHDVRNTPPTGSPGFSVSRGSAGGGGAAAASAGGITGLQAELRPIQASDVVYTPPASLSFGGKTLTITEFEFDDASSPGGRKIVRDLAANRSAHGQQARHDQIMEALKESFAETLNRSNRDLRVKTELDKVIVDNAELEFLVGERDTILNTISTDAARTTVALVQFSTSDLVKTSCGWALPLAVRTTVSGPTSMSTPITTPAHPGHAAAPASPAAPVAARPSHPAPSPPSRPAAPVLAASHPAHPAPTASAAARASSSAGQAGALAHSQSGRLVQVPGASFDEAHIDGNGDCGFEALDTDRAAVIACLTEGVEDSPKGEDIRKLVAPEIQIAITEEARNIEIDLKERSAVLQSLEGSRDDLSLPVEVQRGKSQFSEDVLESYRRKEQAKDVAMNSIQALQKALTNNNDDLVFVFATWETWIRGIEKEETFIQGNLSQDLQTKIAQAKQDVATAKQLEREFQAKCETREVFGAYINSYYVQKKDSGYLRTPDPNGTGVMTVISKYVIKKPIEIWQLRPQNQTELGCRIELSGQDQAETLHIIHKRNHYNKLIPNLNLPKRGQRHLNTRLSFNYLT